MVLKENLRKGYMLKGENVTSYLSRIQAVRYELATIGEKLSESDLVHTTHNGSPRSGVHSSK